MADGNKKKGAESYAQAVGKTRRELPLYLAVVLVLIALAALSLLAVPRGTQLQRCMGALVGKESCIERLALLSSNSSMCRYLPQGTADSCYYTIALNKTDSSLCPVINNTQIKSNCFFNLAAYSGNYLLCNNLNSSYKSTCLFSLASAHANLTACSYLANQSVRLSCYSTVYFDMAISLSKPVYCSYITSNNNTKVSIDVLKNQNFKSDSSFNTYVSEIMQYIAFSNTSFGARDSCYVSLAVHTKNTSLCTNIKNTTVNDLCIIYGAQRAPAVNATSLNYTLLYGQCKNQGFGAKACTDSIGYLKAIQTKNLSICGNLSDAYSSQCYATIAQITNNTGDCNYIRNSTFRLACLLNFQKNLTKVNTG